MHLIGRDPEVGRLSELLDAAASGRGASVLLHGEAGTGKSALLGTVRDLAAARDFRILVCRGDRVERGAAFEGLHELLFPLLGGLDALPSGGRSALAVPFGLEEGVHGDRLTTGLATLGLIGQTVTEGPLLLIVEDLHWLDLSTAEIITFLAGRLEPVPVLLVATSRLEAMYPDRRQYFGHELGLAELDDAEADALLDAVEPSLAPHQRRRIVAEAGGNPLALTEWSNDPTWQERAADAEVMRPPLGRRLEHSLRTEVSMLPAATQRALLVAAAGEDLSRPEVLAAAVELELADRDFLPAQRFGLLGPRDDVIAFRHPLVSSAVYDAADAGVRSRIHAALARAALHPSAAAHHRAAAVLGWDEEVASQMQEQAIDASSRGARTEAAAAWRRAATLTPGAADRSRRTIAAAEAARQAGLTESSATLLAAAEVITFAPQERLDLARVDWMLSSTGAHEGKDGAELIELSRSVRGLADRLEVLAWAAVRCYLGQERDPAIAPAIVAELVSIRAPRAGSERVFREIAVALVDPRHPAPDVDGALDHFRAARRESDTLLLNGLALTVEDTLDLEAATTVWSAAAEHFRRAGSTPDEIAAIAGRGTASITANQLRSGLVDSEHALRVAPELGLPGVGALAAVNLARVRARQGEHDLARTSLDTYRALGGGQPTARLAALAAWTEGIIAANRGEHEVAVRHLVETLEHPPIGTWAGGDLADSAMRIGQVDVVERWLELVAPTAGRHPSAHLSMLVDRTRAQLAKGERARHHFEQALRHGEQSTASLDLATTRVLFAEWLRRDRRVVEAREQLAAALATCRQDQVGPWIERAEAELRAAGGVERARRQRLDVVQLLSAQELHVARLAAAGLSNRQIADQIHLSHRTVGSHLHRAYGKLGITRRADLARALDAGTTRSLGPATDVESGLGAEVSGE